MRRPTLALLAALGLLPAARPCAAAEPSPARALIERSIAYHDPGGRWWSAVRTIALRQPGEGGTERRTTFVLHPDAVRFGLRVADDSVGVSGEIGPGTCTVTPFGADLDAARRRYEKMDCARLELYRSYYGYLFNAPMNLLDPGGTLDPAVFETTFMERAVHGIRVGYGPKQPAWEFFFDPATAALVGCRFANDPEWKTGEYLVYTGVAEGGGVRLPRERAWYYNENGKWLATDIIESLAVDAADGGR